MTADGQGRSTQPGGARGDASLSDASTKRGVAELILVRHGESLGNIADREAIAAKAHRLALEDRDADVELSPTGEEQAGAVVEHLRGMAEAERPTVVLSSPYRRAYRTAEIATEGSDLGIVIDERLRERELGLFDGVTWYGIEADHPEEAARRAHLGKYYYRPPGGESWCDVILRIRQLLLELEERFAGERLWIFTHQAVIMAFRAALEGLSEAEVLDADKQTPAANCSLTRYARDEQGSLSLVSYAMTEHLQREDAEVTHEEPHTEESAEGGAPQ